MLSSSCPGGATVNVGKNRSSLWTSVPILDGVLRLVGSICFRYVPESGEDENLNCNFLSVLLKSETYVLKY